MRNMATALLRHETIRTTLPQGQGAAARRGAGSSALGKNDSLAGRRRAFALLRDDEIVRKLFEDLGRASRPAPRLHAILKMESRRATRRRWR